MMGPGDTVEVYSRGGWVPANVIQSGEYPVSHVDNGHGIGRYVIAVTRNGRRVYRSGNDWKGYSFREVTCSSDR